MWTLFLPTGAWGHLLDDHTKRPLGLYREEGPTVSSYDHLSWNFWKPLGSIIDVCFNFQGRLGILIQWNYLNGPLRRKIDMPWWKKTASLFILTGKTSNFILTRQKWEEADKVSKWGKETERQMNGWMDRLTDGQTDTNIHSWNIW